MNNVDRFINAFVKIEKQLKDIIGISKHLKFYQLLNICRSKNLIVKMNYQKLLDYADLRNAIIHQRDDNNEVLAIPTDSVVIDIEKIADLISNKKTVLEFASKPVKVVSFDDDIYEAFKVMKKIGTSKIPVYDKNTFRGLLTMNDIANTLINNISTKINEISFKDNKVIFFEKNRNVDDIIIEFERYIESGNSLNAIIITETGNINENPLGIITVYDLPKIIGCYI